MNLRAANSILGHRSSADFLNQSDGPSVSRARSAVWLVGLVAAFFQAWAFRWVVNPDGISYLDIARACTNGNWHSLVNGYWSPLYPFLLSFVLRVKPSLYWESTVAHLANFGIFILSFASFEFFLSSLVKKNRNSHSRETPWHTLPAWMLWILGDLLFVWLTLLFIQLWQVAPDLLVAALVYLSTGLLVQIWAGQGNLVTYTALGATLGVSYLAKAVMFPLSFVFRFCCLFAKRPFKRSLPRIALALLIFLLIASPFLLVLSRAKRRITFGDAGKINYAEFVDGATRYVRWLGGPTGTGMPIHPPRLVRSRPPLFVFDGPVKGSYPLWYDPSYWYAGIVARFSPKDQLRAIRYTIQEYAAMLPYVGGLFVGFVGLTLFAASDSKVWRQLFDQWPVWIPAGAALGLYGLIYVESRFVAPFFVLICIGLFAGLRFPDSPTARLLEKCITMAMAIMLCVGIVWSAGRSFFRALAPGTFVQWSVAETLGDMGVRPGDCVGSIGDSLGAYWAHLAGVRIIAEIPQGGVADYLSSPPQIQSEVLADFARAGATVIVTDQKSLTGTDRGWRAIGETGFFVHSATDESSPPQTRP